MKSEELKPRQNAEIRTALLNRKVQLQEEIEKVDLALQMIKDRPEFFKVAQYVVKEV